MLSLATAALHALDQNQSGFTPPHSVAPAAQGHKPDHPQGGYRVAMIARNAARLRGIAAAVQAAGSTVASYSADLSDHAAVRTVVSDILAEQGSPSVVVWNAAVWVEATALTLDVHDFDRQLRLGLTGALVAIQAAAPSMSASGGGSVIFTGGGLALAPRYGGAVPALTAVKAALRAFVYASAPEFAAQRIRLCTVTIAGQVAPGTNFDPDLIAQAFWGLHTDAEAKVEHVVGGS